VRRKDRRSGDACGPSARVGTQDRATAVGWAPPTALAKKAGFLKDTRYESDRHIRHPITTVPNATAQLNLSAPTVRSAVETLETLGIVREITGKQRDRIYIYDRYLGILDKGTEPLPQ
jgi:hypothetical protein